MLGPGCGGTGTQTQALRQVCVWDMKNQDTDMGDRGRDLLGTGLGYGGPERAHG